MAENKPANEREQLEQAIAHLEKAAEYRRQAGQNAAYIAEHAGDGALREAFLHLPKVKQLKIETNNGS